LAQAEMQVPGKLPQPAPAADLIETFQSVTAQVETLRQLKFLVPVKSAMKSKSEITSYIMQRMKEEYEEQELIGEERAMKFLGLVPASFQLKKTYINLLTEQVAGFYDPPTDTFYMADWISPAVQKPIIAHELTHALQDQYFELEKRVKRIKGNDDRNMSFMSLVEGEATAVMLDYSLGGSYANFSILPDLANMMRSQMETINNQFPVFKTAPPILREGLLFPYVYGVHFLQEFRKSQPWDGLTAVYKDPPTSTEQILHPEKYLIDKEIPREFSRAPLEKRLAPGYSPEFSNVLGEFGLKILLETYLDSPSATLGAEGWAGDRYILFRSNQSAKNEMLVMTSQWDSLKDTLEFFHTYRNILLKRYPKFKEIANEPDLHLWQNGKSFILLRKVDCQVFVTEMLPESLLGQFQNTPLNTISGERTACNKP
jgi:hypothetical protein